MANSIDRVNLVHNERLDKPDADRLQAFVDAAVQRSFGGMLGHGSGVVSPFLHTYNAGAATLSFGRFQYYLGDGNPNMIDPGTGNYKGWTGGFHEHNPAVAGQAQTFSIAAAKAAASANNMVNATPYIYVQPTTALVATEARNQWVAGAPTPVSMTTVVKVVHTFQFSTTAPDSMAGWACIGRISSWSAPGNLDPGIPTIEHISFLDNVAKCAVNGLPAAAIGTSLAGMYPWVDGLSGDSVPALSPVVGGADTHKDLGILQVLTAIRGQLARILDSTGGRPWWQNPYNGNQPSTARGGLKQVWEYIQTLFFDFHSQMPIPWAVGRYTWDGAQYNLNSPARNVGTATRNAAGDVTVNLPNPPPAGYTVCTALAVAGPDAGGNFNRGCTVLTASGANVHINRFVCNTGAMLDGGFRIVVYIVKN